jgi:hypothetical protein
MTAPDPLFVRVPAPNDPDGTAFVSIYPDPNTRKGWVQYLVWQVYCDTILMDLDRDAERLGADVESRKLIPVYVNDVVVEYKLR